MGPDAQLIPPRGALDSLLPDARRQRKRHDVDASLHH